MLLLSTNNQKILLAAGCSHSCGTELGRPGAIERSQYNIDNCYAGILANDLNFKHINIARLGCSNKFIMSNVIHHVHLLLKEHEPEKIFVTVGWTGFPRSEVIYDDRLISWSIASDMHPDWAKRPEPVKKFQKLWKKFINYDALVNQQVLNYILLKNFLENKKINYLFFNSVESLICAKKDYFHHADNENVDTVGYETAKSDNNYYYPFDTSKTLYNTLKKKYDPFEGGRWHHFTRDAHKEWAETLKPFIKDRI